MILIKLDFQSEAWGPQAVPEKSHRGPKVDLDKKQGYLGFLGQQLLMKNKLIRDLKANLLLCGFLKEN